MFTTWATIKVLFPIAAYRLAVAARFTNRGIAANGRSQKNSFVCRGWVGHGRCLGALRREMGSNVVIL
jgi:hypothetical protein